MSGPRLPEVRRRLTRHDSTRVVASTVSYTTTFTGHRARIRVTFVRVVQSPSGTVAGVAGLVS